MLAGHLTDIVCIALRSNIKMFDRFAVRFSRQQYECFDAPTNPSSMHKKAGSSFVSHHWYGHVTGTVSNGDNRPARKVFLSTKQLGRKHDFLYQVRISFIPNFLNKTRFGNDTIRTAAKI